jgi:hypothetical protein
LQEIPNARWSELEPFNTNAIRRVANRKALQDGLLDAAATPHA